MECCFFLGPRITYFFVVMVPQVSEDPGRLYCFIGSSSRGEFVYAAESGGFRLVSNFIEVVFAVIERLLGQSDSVTM